MSLHKLSVKAVIFDMDGVITNTMPDHYRAWVKILKKEGVAVTHHDIYSREGQRGIHSVEEMFKKYKRSFTNEIAARILKDKEEYFKKIVKTRFVPGARKFLKNLYRRNFKLALVTGTSRHELHQILPDSIYQLFSIVVTGNDVKDGKPHPEPYLKALKKLRIRAIEAVVIENAPFGIQSAKHAGLRCLALETSLPKKYLKRADFIFPSIKNLNQNVRFVLKEDKR